MMYATEPADLTASVAAAELLAHFWSRPVEAEVVQWRAWETAVGEVVEAFGPEGGAGGLDLEHPVDELLEEYERLFVGPGPVPCPPYESYWRLDAPIDVRRSLMGPCVPELTKIYAGTGICLLADSGELADFVAIELEALAHCLATGEVASAKVLLDEHLGRWLPRFCREVAGQADLPFYRSLSAVTLAWAPAIRRQI